MPGDHEKYDLIKYTKHAILLCLLPTHCKENRNKISASKIKCIFMQFIRSRKPYNIFIVFLNVLN